MPKTIVHNDDWWQYQLRVANTKTRAEISSRAGGLARFVAHVLHLEQNPGTILDLGCGAGAFTTALARQCPESTVIGIDSCESLINHCRNIETAASFKHGDMFDDHKHWPVEIDHVVMIGGTFGLFEDVEHLQLLQAMRRHLKPGGQILLQQPDPQRLINVIQTRRISTSCDVTETYYFVGQYDPYTQCTNADFWMIDEHGTKHIQDGQEVFRVYGCQELARMISRVELELTQVYGNTNIPTELYGPVCHNEMIVVATKPGDRQ